MERARDVAQVSDDVEELVARCAEPVGAVRGIAGRAERFHPSSQLEEPLQRVVVALARDTAPRFLLSPEHLAGPGARRAPGKVLLGHVLQY